MEESWTFPEKFDFVHARYLAIAIVDWPRLIHQAFTNTTPGGWAEFQDFEVRYYSEDGSLKDDYAVMEWINTLREAGREFGREPSPGPLLEGWMKDEGFKGVQVEKFRIPIGPWPKDKHLVMFPLPTTLTTNPIASQ